MTIHLAQKELIVLGYLVMVDHQLGHLMVSHDGRITWDQLQAIKCEVWGADARAIEVYPRAADVVNTGHFRHLWRLGQGDFCPDLLQHEPSLPEPWARDHLEARHREAWAEAEEVFR